MYYLLEYVSTEHIRYKYKICIDVKTDIHNIPVYNTFYKIKKNTSMPIWMHLITLFRVMNPHQRCLQAKVKYRNKPKQVMPKTQVGR